MNQKQINVNTLSGEKGAPENRGIFLSDLDITIRANLEKRGVIMIKTETIPKY